MIAHPGEVEGRGEQDCDIYLHILAFLLIYLLDGVLKFLLKIEI